MLSPLQELSGSRTGDKLGPARGASWDAEADHTRKNSDVDSDRKYSITASEQSPQPGILWSGQIWASGGLLVSGVDSVCNKQLTDTWVTREPWCSGNAPVWSYCVHSSTP